MKTTLSQEKSFWVVLVYALELILALHEEVYIKLHYWLHEVYKTSNTSETEAVSQHELAEGD